MPLLNSNKLSNLSTLSRKALIWSSLVFIIGALLPFVVPIKFRIFFLCFFILAFIFLCCTATLFLFMKYRQQDNIPVGDIFPIKDDKSREAALKYYEYVRQEIKREDEITHQRVTWSMTFQGFVISAVTLLLILVWDGTRKIAPIGKFSLLAVGIIGISIGFITLMGVLASRKSLEEAKMHWEERNKAWNLYPSFVPQTYGQGSAFRGGDYFAIFLPCIFIMMWALFLSLYGFVAYILWIEPCLENETFLSCILNDGPKSYYGKFLDFAAQFFGT